MKTVTKYRLSNRRTQPVEVLLKTRCFVIPANGEIILAETEYHEPQIQYLRKKRLISVTEISEEIVPPKKATVTNRTKKTRTNLKRKDKDKSKEK